MHALVLLALLSWQTQTPPALGSRIRALIAASGAEVAVAYRTLDGRSEVLIDPDTPFHAASTMKVPVMIELFRQAEAGLLKLDDPLPIRNEFRSIVDGSPYTLSEGDDSDREVYANAGGTMTLRALNEAMITVSSNFATNLMIEKLDVEKIRATVTRLGADGMKVLRGVEDSKAFAKGMNNSTTARGLLVLFEKLGRGEAVSAAADAEMIEVLKRQKFGDAIPAGLPSGTPVAHKTGYITRIQHDAGIVYGPRPYVIVVLVRGIEDAKKSKALIADVSKAVWEHTASLDGGDGGSGGSGVHKRRNGGNGGRTESLYLTRQFAPRLHGLASRPLPRVSGRLHARLPSGGRWSARPGSTTRLTPSFSTGTLKLISNPTGRPVSFRYVSNCAVWMGANAFTLLTSTITVPSMSRSISKRADSFRPRYTSGIETRVATSSPWSLSSYVKASS